MSEYVKCQTQFRDQEMLVLALMETQGWKREQIEVHQDPQSLYGYHGDVRPEKAHVIVRRAHIGYASNDIGFTRQADGSFTAVISEFDRGQGRFDARWTAKLKENYAYRVIERQQTARGRAVTKTTGPNGRTRIVVGGYR